MKIRDVIKLLEDDGWFLVTTKGSHVSTNTQRKGAALQSQGNPEMISLQAH